MPASLSKTAPLAPDLCVIGGGPAGLAAAFGAAALGASVVLIEKAELGGARLNDGAVAFSVAIVAGRRAAERRRDERFGFERSRPGLDYAAARAETARIVAALAPNLSQARLEALGVRVVRAAGRFTARDTVEAGGQVVKARRFIIATGSLPAPIRIPGLDVVRHFTSANIFELADPPEKLVMIGGDPGAIALAQAFGRLGSQVTLLEPGRALEREDPELALIALGQARREGVIVHEAVAVHRVEPRGSGVEVTFAGRGGEMSAAGSQLLLAVGRRPNLDGLGLEAAGLVRDEKGLALRADLRSRANRRVYAIGDAAGGPPSVQAAAYHARLVLRATLFGRPGNVGAAPVPRLVRTDPEIAWVGLGEAEARARHGAIRVLRFPFAENERAMLDDETVGHVKAITTRRGRILGAGVVGAGAGEVLAPWAVALTKGLNVLAVANTVAPYPTRAEASREAAAAFLAPSLRNPWVRRILGLVRRFG